MINTQVHPVDRIPVAKVLQALIEEHGIWHVLRALPGAFFIATPPQADAGDLNDYLRRDIGLDPLAERGSYWNVRI